MSTSSSASSASAPSSSADDASGRLAAHDYVHNLSGLFPLPCSRSLKAGPLAKVRSKFRFVGKFIAKAIMDSRMVGPLLVSREECTVNESLFETQLDLPFNPVFYRWLLGQESFLTGSDLVQVDPVLAKTYKSLARLADEKRRLEHDQVLTPQQRQAAVQSLTLDGCPVVDLGLDFTLPGTAIELRKGGKDIPVTIQNLEQYLKVLLSTEFSEDVLIESASRSAVVALDPRGGCFSSNGIIEGRIRIRVPAPSSVALLSRRDGSSALRSVSGMLAVTKLGFS